MPLDPDFDAATAGYTASVRHGASTITVAPTTNDAKAMVAYLDENNTGLTDADLDIPGHQVNLEDGSTTVKVKVTAEDGNTTETYTVVVTREAPTMPEAPGGLGATPVSPTQIYLYWTAPSNFADSAITGYQYRWSTDGGETWSRQWTDIHGFVKRPDVTDHTVYWLDSATEYTFQVRAENAEGKGAAATVKRRPGEPDVSRPMLTIEKIAAKDRVIAGKTDSTQRLESGSWVNGVFVGNGTYVDGCHDDAFAHYRIHATGGDHIWLPRSQFRGISVRIVEHQHGGSVSESVTGLVGHNAGSIVPGNRYWDQKECIYESAAEKGPLTVRLVPGEEYDIGNPSEICIRVDHEDGGVIVPGTACPAVSEANIQDPLPDMRVNDAGANEANGGIGFLVTLDRPATTTVTVDYATVDGTATAPADYTETRGTLTFAVGDTQKIVTVPLVDDAVPDSGETFKLVLGNVSGAVIADAEAIGTILNTETAALTGFTLVNADAASDVGSIGNGARFTLDDAANGRFGVRVETAENAAIGSVRLELSGAKTTARTENVAPWSLYGDDGTTLKGEGLPAGSYTLSATAYSKPNLGGDALQTLTVSFTVVAANGTTVEEPEPEPLTAAFQDAPAAHDGPDSTFVFKVLFSEAIPTGYTVLRDQAFEVSAGGVVTKAKRVDGRNDLREIHVDTSTWDDVTVTLPGNRACNTTGAICMNDGRQLTNSPTATVRGPVAVTVADAKVDEGPGATLDFVVTLSRGATETVTVDYATADGTATAGDDYTAASGTLSFAAGETQRTVSVTVLDDAHDEGEETMKLVLSNASGARIRDAEATGTIENSDPIPKAWLARFGRTVADHVVDAVGTRLAGPSGSSGGGSQVTLGGQTLSFGGTGGGTDSEEAEREAAEGLRSLAERMSGTDEGTAWTRWERGDDASETRAMTERELLLGSAFVLSVGGDGDGAGAGGTRWTAWGRAAASRFDGEADGLILDGDVTTLTLGADAAWSRWLAGVAVAYSTGDGGFRNHERTDHGSLGSGSLSSTLTSVHPYARLSLSERLSVWGILGYGTGDLDLEMDGGKRWTTGVTMTMAAAGARGVLVEAPAEGGLELALRTDAVVQRTESDSASGGNLAATEAGTSRVRLMVEGSRAFAMDGGGRFTPSLEVGLRQDGGDAETGTGVELGGGLSYSDPASGLTLEAKARGLIAHEDADYREWGAGASVRLDPGASGRGLSLNVSPAWGAANGGPERLWSVRDARGLAANDAFDPAGRLDAEAGYGLAAFGGRGAMTPYARLALSEAGDRAWRSGVRWTLGSDISLGLEGTRREPANGDAAEHGLAFRATMRW